MINYQEYLQQGWATTGRTWLTTYSGLTWNAALRRWDVKPGWISANGPAQKAYTAEAGLQIGLNIAIGQSDDLLIDELASFYLGFMLNRMTTLGALRAEAASTSVPAGEVDQIRSLALLKDQGPDATRTIAWYEKLSTGKIRVRECLLCNVQFFHPASRLLKAIAMLPTQRRTPAMTEFTQTYTSFLVQDNLIRIGFVSDTSYYGLTPFPRQRVEAWKAIIAATVKPPLSYQHAMSDADLWLIGSAAEVLGANAVNPTLVQLSTTDASSLKEVVSVGSEMFQKKRTVYPDTKNFAGHILGSVSYLNGDYDDHADMAFARYFGETYPTEADKAPAVHGGWSITHFHRVPIFISSLYENKHATGIKFPTAADDIRLLVNHYVYRVFQGDLARPLFNNFSDGNNGWYRVGYAGRVGFGYPPAEHSSQFDSQRPCMTAGIFGWGRLAGIQPDLLKVQEAVVAMAESTDPAMTCATDQCFRERYYRNYGKSFSYTDATGKQQYPLLLLRVLSDLLDPVVP